uniref:Lysophospholipid acyltransferase 5 n=1 Tax=Heligmosomoides polygyrus TaxID=6339 RepID=A0A183FMZ9_HELPZ
LVLRMIGLMMNVYDGVNYEKLKSDQKKVAIKKLPCLLEIASFAFFYTGTFVGPQFTLFRFRSYMRGDLLDEKRQPRESAKKEALNRFVTGCVYAVVNLWGMSFIPNSYFNMEGAAILNGLGFNGRDERGEIRWDGVRDLDPWKCETARAFNRGTNTWPLAHVITLGYLAIWYGYHLGYFHLFGFEFGCVMAQQQLYSLIKQSPAWARFNMEPAVRPLLLLFGRLVVLYSTSFVFLTFGLVKTRNWIGPIKSLYFAGYIFYFFIWPLLHKLLLSVLDIDKKSRARSPTTSEFTTKTISERSRISL